MWGKGGALQGCQILATTPHDTNIFDQRMTKSGLLSSITNFQLVAFGRLERLQDTPYEELEFEHELNDA